MAFKKIIFFLLCVISINIYSQQSMIQPPYLKAGDTVAIVAPSGVLKIRTNGVQQEIELLKNWR